MKPIIVEVYLNTHATAWSVRAKGKVIGHATYVALHNVSFVVQQSGRLRSIKDGHKNVHAWAKGELVLDKDTLDKIAKLDMRNLKYDPRSDTTFLDLITKEPVTQAAWAEFVIIGKEPAAAYYA